MKKLFLLTALLGLSVPSMAADDESVTNVKVNVLHAGYSDSSIIFNVTPANNNVNPSGCKYPRTLVATTESSDIKQLYAMLLSAKLTNTTIRDIRISGQGCAKGQAYALVERVTL